MEITEAKPEDYLLPAKWQTLSIPMALVGVGLVVASWPLFAMAPVKEGSSVFSLFCHSYLANFMYILSFGIGGMFLTLVSFLTRAGWSASIRRMAEILSVTIPWVSLLFIPIALTLFLSNGAALYEWNGADVHGLVAKKTDYLNAWFFLVRSIFYIVVWTVITVWYFRMSVRQDTTKDIDSTLVRQKWSGPFIMLFALTVSFASFDWVMSLDADWYSTIFGVYYFAASMFGMFALMILGYLMLQAAGKVKKTVTIEHYHDMAKFLFGFIMFWSYIAFSQLLLYWYGNIPEETNWYRVRWEYGWDVYSLGLIAVHFAIPFLFMLSRHVRRNRTGLMIGAIWCLVVHWMDMAYLVMPNASVLNAPMLIAHAVGGVGMMCIFLGIAIMRANHIPLIAKGDPRLHEALSYANPIL